MSARHLTFFLLATGFALPAAAQGLENGVGSGPSEQLSVPPNDRGKPDFSYGDDGQRRSSPSEASRQRHRRPRRPATAGPSGPTPN